MKSQFNLNKSSCSKVQFYTNWKCISIIMLAVWLMNSVKVLGNVAVNWVFKPVPNMERQNNEIDGKYDRKVFLISNQLRFNQRIKSRLHLWCRKFNNRCNQNSNCLFTKLQFSYFLFLFSAHWLQNYWIKKDEEFNNPWDFATRNGWKDS